MCEFSGKLVAWLDHELAEEEASRLGQHLENCAECREQVAVFGEVSGQLTAYYDAVLRGSSGQRRGWLALAGGVIAAAIALILLMPRITTNPVPLPLPPPAAAHAPAIAWQTTPVVRTPLVHRPRTTQPVETQNARWQPAATEIQIAIPAEAVFPPGALPQGFEFIADFSVAADGSPHGLRIIP
jgi:Putative zinc-finger